MTEQTAYGAWHQTSPTITNLCAAFVAAQGNLANIVKDQTANAGQYAYKYADLGTVLAAVRPLLAGHGLAITQTAETDDDDVLVWTTLLHTSGEFITARPIRLPAGKTVQQTGSAVTYGRRYALLALLSIGTEDDDGATAAPRNDRIDRPARLAPRPAPVDTAPPAPEARSNEERLMRSLLADLPTAEAKALRQAFRSEFGATLADLPVDQHPAALAWLEQQVQVLA